jgi:hypothetical protein
MFNTLSKPMKCKPQLRFNSNLTTTFFFSFKILRIKRQLKINKQIDRVFFHTPKLESHIVHSVYYINTLPGVRKHQSVKKARASPKLKHEHTCHKLTAKFLTETNIKRLIVVKNKNKIARNKIKNERNQMYKK